MYVNDLDCGRQQCEAFYFSIFSGSLVTDAYFFFRTLRSAFSLNCSGAVWTAGIKQRDVTSPPVVRNKCRDSYFGSYYVLHCWFYSASMANALSEDPENIY